ncbi:hypothetical protein [Flavobacterium sp.]|uniref:hypothetical protein n=1 Tax=Flavobacterium sp. TaxID=239 RepID=UPI003752D32B
MKKFFLRNKVFILLIFVLKSFAQDGKCEKTYYSNDKTSFIEDSSLRYINSKGSIYFKNDYNVKLYFYKDKLFLNKKAVYQFKNVEYYYYLVYLKKDNKEYIYIYPHYKSRPGPYIWYELGILVEIEKKQIIIKGNIDYFESFEICDVIDFNKYKVVKRIPLS